MQNQFLLVEMSIIFIIRPSIVLRLMLEFKEIAIKQMVITTYFAIIVWMINL